MTGVLSVSGERVNCHAVAEAMLRLGIAGDVTKNLTALDGRIEPGCRVRVVSEPRSNTLRLWTALRDEMRLECAHVELRHSEAGCVFDVYRPSSCPGK